MSAKTKPEVKSPAAMMAAQRFAKMTPAERSELAKKAARARWKKK